MEYPFEESKEPNISEIEGMESMYPYFFDNERIAVIGCIKEEWETLFRHTIQMGHMTKRKKAYFVWDEEEHISVKLKDYEIEISQPCRESLDRYGIGQCLPLLETPYNTLMSFCHLNVPVQMYVSPANPDDSRNSTNELSRIIPYISHENPSCLPLISNFNENVFCHATLQLNMGNKNNAYYVRDVISYCSAHGFKGVVFHCGKTTNKTVEQTIENMFENILNGMDQVRMIVSKFLLETPAGQNGEVLDDIFSFINFVKKLRKNNTNIEVCVDTCHVFQAGYDPVYYILKLLEENVPIGLVHFNDSVKSIGSGVDRHASPGKGKIPPSFLRDVAKICKNAKIPAIYEC